MTHKCLGRYGYSLKESELSQQDIEKIKKELTVKPIVLAAYAAKATSYKIYYRDKDCYYVPRFWGIKNFSSPEYVALSSGLPMNENVSCSFEPMSHQIEAFKKLNVIFAPGKQLGDGGVLSLPCGYGKTFCAIKTAVALKLKTLIIVPTECLMDQWTEAINTFCTGAKTGSIQRDNINVENCDFVVAMLHSMCLKDYPFKLFDQFGLTIYDECHHIGSETFSKSVMKIRTKYILGLSATPTRKDGLSDVFYNFMGPLFHQEKRTGSNQIIIKKISCYSKCENYNVLYLPAGTKNTSGMITAISQMKERNSLIIHILGELCRQGRKILLLSSRKEHLHVIKELLTLKNFKHHTTGKPITYGLYYGKQGMNRQTHKALLAESAKSDIVLGIDIIAKEGLDIPDRNTLVWATPPGMEIEQPVGRILRKYHKDVNPMIIDIVDNTGNFKNHSRERDKWFLTEDYIIHDHKVEFLDKYLDLKESDDSAITWKDNVSEYIHKMIMKQKLLKSSEKEACHDEEEICPDFSECILNDEDGVKPLEKKIKAKIKKEKCNDELKPKTTCYLNYTTVVKKDVKVKENKLMFKCLI